MFVDDLAEDIRKYRFTFNNEKELQDQLAECFKEQRWQFTREVRLDGDPIDFLFGTIGVEVKIGGSINGHLYQLKRYANHPKLTAIILIATKPFCVPETLSGKPCHCINLGHQLL